MKTSAQLARESADYIREHGLCKDGSFGLTMTKTMIEPLTGACEVYSVTYSRDLCGAQAVERLDRMCVHEHRETFDVCEHHQDIVLVCTPCFDADGHECLLV